MRVSSPPSICCRHSPPAATGLPLLSGPLNVRGVPTGPRTLGGGPAPRPLHRGSGPPTSGERAPRRPDRGSPRGSRAPVLECRPSLCRRAHGSDVAAGVEGAYANAQRRGRKADGEHSEQRLERGEGIERSGCAEQCDHQLVADWAPDHEPSEEAGAEPRAAGCGLRPAAGRMYVASSAPVSPLISTQTT
jgi:hypothetical protein